MVIRIFITFLSLSIGKAMSQNFWALPYLGNAPSPYYLEKILTDTVHDKLILSSKWVNYAGGKKVRGVWSWNGSVWDSLTSGINTHDQLNDQPNGNILSGIAYNGKFLVGGNFESIGGVKATSLATWDGLKWDSLPVRAFKFLDYGGSIYSFINFNNKLYIGGIFDTIQGQKANGLATYDGISFQAVNVPLNNQAAITDMKVFNGELYISGVFTYTGQAGNRHILKYNGSSWSDVGGGILGAGASNVASMCIFNNELYVGGYFLKSAGNVGDLIMKWNGNSWQEANWGDEYNNGGIWKLIKHKNKMFALGTFNLSGNNPASKISIFDGSIWCTYADNFSGDITTASIYHDTLFVAGDFKNITGDTGKKLVAKLVYPDQIQNCNNVGIKILEDYFSEISIYPNPVQNQFKLIIESQFYDSSLKIYDSLGRLVYSLNQVGKGQEVDISALESGIYYLKFNLNEKEHTTKIFKE